MMWEIDAILFGKIYSTENGNAEVECT